MVSKPKKVSDEKSDPTEDPAIKEFMKFFKIELKSEEDYEEMPKKKKKQYECRVKRWNSLVNTHIEYEIYRSQTKFENFKHLIPLYKAKIDEIRTDPEVMPEFDRNKLKKLEADHKNMTKELEELRQQFEDIYIPYKKQQSEEAEEMLQIKKEMDSECDIKADDYSDNDIDIKEEYVSDEEEDIKEEYISEEDIKEEDLSEDDIKEEYISEEDIKEECVSDDEIKEEYVSEDDTMESNGEYFSAKEEDNDDKTSIKKEIKSEFDVKKEFKTEIKSEIKDEIKAEEDDDSN